MVLFKYFKWTHGEISSVSLSLSINVHYWVDMVTKRIPQLKLKHILNPTNTFNHWLNISWTELITGFRRYFHNNRCSAIMKLSCFVNVNIILYSLIFITLIISVNAYLKLWINSLSSFLTILGDILWLFETNLFRFNYILERKPKSIS